MLLKTSRFLLIILVVITAAIVLPEYFWISFGDRVITPVVRYSPVSDEYIIGRYADRSYTYFTEKGQKITNDESDSLMPFMNYRLLAAREKMPDSLKGIKIELEDVRLNSVFERVRPYYIDVPSMDLYPLFESQPKRLKLTLPTDFFRITDRMEFIDASSNTIDEVKSEEFTALLRKEGFRFPAINIFGNPTTRKPFDEGYFVVDSAHKLFHIKMIKGEPFCENTNIPENIRVKFMKINEMSLREFYGLLYDQDDNVYLVMYDNYRLQKLPLDAYRPGKDQLVFLGNMFYRNFNIFADTVVHSYTFNREYELVDTYQESWKGEDSQWAGVLGRYLFPFSIQLQSSESSYINFYFSDLHYTAIFANIFFVILALIVQRFRKNVSTRKWYDLLLVLITGVYGFLAVLIFENTDTL